MSITKTDTDYEHYSTTVHGNSNCSDYVRFNVDVWFDVVTSYGTFPAVYQTGNTYIGNDHSLPSPVLYLVSGVGCDDVLWAVSQIEGGSFAGEDFKGWQEEYAEYSASSIPTLADLKELWHFLQDNTPKLSDFDLGSDNPEDYERVDDYTGGGWKLIDKDSE